MNRSTDQVEAAGLPARRFAFSLVTRVLDQRVTLEEAGDALKAVAGRMEARDAAFGRAIAYASLRHKGALEAVIARFVTKPLPEHGLAASRVLLTGAAELLVLDGKAHAAVDGANHVALATREAKPFKALVNAVLRRVAAEGRDIWTTIDRPRLNTPDWLWTRWEAAYGVERARAIAEAHETPAPLDVSVKSGPEDWAARLNGELVAADSVRLGKPGAVETLDGFTEGAWWVQDAAAAIPACWLLRLTGDPAGKRLADLCAAPGGKTMQLAASGAEVIAVDMSGPRLKRLRENLDRTGLNAEIVKTDLRQWSPAAPFDGVLLDAPCSATGTIRRHPELPHIRDEGAIHRPAAVTRELLDAAWSGVKPGGYLVFSVCSLEPEEGEDQIAAFLDRHIDAVAVPAEPTQFGLPEAAATGDGLRILPSMLAETGGMDGFFVAALRRA